MPQIFLQPKNRWFSVLFRKSFRGLGACPTEQHSPWCGERKATVKRTLAALSAAAVVGGLFVASGPSGPAQASGSLPILRIDCTSAESIRSSLAGLAGSSERVLQFPSGTPSASTVWVLSTVVVGDLVVVENIATPPDPLNTSRDCVVDQRDTLVGGEVTVAPQGFSTTAANANPPSDDMSVDNSGYFTIKSRGDGVEIKIHADACSLAGSGIEPDPWRVRSLLDLQEVGLESQNFQETSCLLSGHYLQTAPITNFNAEGGDFEVSRNNVVFTGTYDGGHWGITHQPGTETPHRQRAIFRALGTGGVIKKLRVGGHMKSENTEVAGVVSFLEGGTISEVSSTVRIESEDSDALLGGLVAVSRNADSLIQYSHYVGQIEWSDPDSTSTEGPAIGGLVGHAAPASGGPVTLTIRDSYARAALRFDSGDIEDITGTFVYAGGLVGVDGQVSGSISGGTFTRTDSNSNLRVVRSYAAGSFTNTCVGDATECRTAKVSLGGLVGYSTNNGINDVYVSNYWLNSAGTAAIGSIRAGQGSQPGTYTSLGGQSVPVAVPVSSSILMSAATFQSREDATTSGQPSGVPNLTEASSTLTLAEQDYRWAIESGDVQVFVAQRRTESPSRTGETVTFTRAFDRMLWTNSDVPTATYTTRGVSQTVNGYPPLGRVWEICAEDNSGYPVLVWEERTCGEGGGRYTGSRDSQTSDAQLSEALAAGLSGAELAAFLASGLTLEQWLAQRLAATGTPAQMLAQGLLAGALLAITGLGLVLVRRRLGLGNAQ
jgi:hypothetical protein